MRTERTGAAAKAGHDLLIHVIGWEATLEVGDDPSIVLEVDPTSHTGAVIAAINGLYLAEYAEAARCAEAALAISPGARKRNTCQMGKFHGMIASTQPMGS